MIVFRILYTIWSSLAFLIFFFVIFPWFWVFVQSKKTYHIAHRGNTIWAYWTFGALLLPIKRIHKGYKPSSKKQVIYMANHSSYLDIPVIFRVIPGFFLIIGKAELSKIPLFGYMYKKVYITVNRKGVKSIKETIDRSIAVLKSGRSMVVYPEGTIPKKNAPHMIPLKDGAFIAALETETPIVPVTLSYNWLVVNGNFEEWMRWKPLKIVFHEKIDTKGMTRDDIPELKKKVHEIIYSQLLEDNKLSHPVST